MRTDAEIVDSRVALRTIAGIFSIAGVILSLISAYKLVAVEFDWMKLFILLGSAYGIYLFGFFAWRGHLPKNLTNNQQVDVSHHTNSET